MCASEKPLGGSQLFFHFGPPTHAAQKHRKTGAASSRTRSHWAWERTNSVEGFPAVCQQGTCQFKCKIKSRTVREKFNFTRQQNNHIFLSIFLSLFAYAHTCTPKHTGAELRRLKTQLLLLPSPGCLLTFFLVALIQDINVWLMCRLQGLPSCHAPLCPGSFLFKQFQISMARVSPQMGIPIQSCFWLQTQADLGIQKECVCVCVHGYLRWIRCNKCLNASD